MTSEFDIPIEALGVAYKRTSDPIAKKAIDEVAGFLNALHYFSHDYARGTAPSPMSPRYDKRTDHWMSKIKSVENRIRSISKFLDNLAELDRQVARDKERLENLAENLAKLEKLYCPTCGDKAPNHLETCGSKEAWQADPEYRIVKCQKEGGLCFCPDCMPEFWKGTEVERITETSWRVPKSTTDKITGEAWRSPK